MACHSLTLPRSELYKFNPTVACASRLYFPFSPPFSPFTSTTAPHPRPNRPVPPPRALAPIPRTSRGGGLPQVARPCVRGRGGRGEDGGLEDAGGSVELLETMGEGQVGQAGSHARPQLAPMRGGGPPRRARRHPGGMPPDPPSRRMARSLERQGRAPSAQDGERELGMLRADWARMGRRRAG